MDRAWLALRLLTASRPRIVIFLAGALAASLASSSILVASVVSEAVIARTVDEGWRGAYDILVRPADSRSLVVDGDRVVQSNYLGVPSTGITREAWTTIRSIPTVEVAAPVAVLGWVKQDDVSVAALTAAPNVGDIIRIDTAVELAGNPAARFVTLVAMGPDGHTSLSIGAHGASTTSDPGELRIVIGDLPSSWGLVVGIDPQAEADLVATDEFLIKGTYLTSGVARIDDPVYGGQAIVVPVLTAAEAPYPGEVKIAVSQIAGADPQAIETAIKNIEGQAIDGDRPFPTAAEIGDLAESMTASAVTTEVVRASAPLRTLITPMRKAPVTLTREGRLVRTFEGPGSYTAFGRNALLVPRVGNYEVRDGALYLERAGSWEADILPDIAKLQPAQFAASDSDFGIDDPIFRPLDVTRPPLFSIQPIGEYDLTALSARFNQAANYVPLGIYADPERRLISDQDGVPVGEPLPLSLNPAGLNPLPPTGLTNLEAVEALRGPRFIDAIRVRVAGIGGYSDEALRRIELVAAAIVQRTGLHVDVVAGSAAMDLAVETEGVGVVSERWTTLGEAVRIQNAASGFSGLLLVVAAAVTMLYLAMFGIYLVGDQGQELAILRLVGWSEPSVRLLVLMESAAVGGVAAILAAGLTILMGRLLGGSVPWELLVVLGVAVGGLHVVSARVAHGAEHSSARQYIRARATPGRFIPRFGGLWLVASATSADSRTRFVGVGVGLAAASTLAGIVLGLQLGLNGELRASVLGQVVAIRLGPYHLLAVAAAFFAATAMSMESALLSVERRIRLIGVVRSFGWRRGAVQRLVLAELSAVAIPAACAATVITVAALWWAGLTLWVAMGIGVGVGIVCIAVGALAALPAADVATRVAPVSALAAEGSSGSLPELTGRATSVTLGGIAVAVVAASIAWTAAMPPAIAANAFVAIPTPVPPTAAADRINADVVAIASHADRLPGAISMSLARAYIERRLADLGYATESLPHRRLAPVLRSADGTELDRERALPSLVFVGGAFRHPNRPDVLGATQEDIAWIDGGAAGDPCPDATLAVLRIGTRIGDAGNIAGVPAQLARCADLEGVLGVTSPDEDWAAAPPIVSTIEVATEEALIGMPPGTRLEEVRTVLVVPLDSDGPGATQSAAAAAVALEVARSLPDADVAVAFTAGPGGVAAVVRQLFETSPTADVVLLGPMGGPPELGIGTAVVPAAITESQLRVGLLASVTLDDAERWLAAASAPMPAATSRQLLTTLGATPSNDVACLNVLFLGVGIDAACIREIGTMGADGSVAGMTTDTADAVNLDTLVEVTSRIMRAAK